MARRRRKKEKCPNCEKSLEADWEFCPVCGQENHYLKVTLKVLFRDFFIDYLTFDSKIFRSLQPLLFRPGVLTREYNAGRRVRYISPLRMYLLISLLFFLVMSLEYPVATNRDGEESKRSVTLMAGGDTVTYNSYDDFIRDITSRELEVYLDSLHVTRPTEKWVIGRMHAIAEKGTGTFYGELLHSISITMFFLLPVLAWILKLFFYRKRLLYVEHLIFSVHLHAFLFLYGAMVGLFSRYIWDLPIFMAAVPVILYCIAAIRNFYEKKWMASAMLFAGAGVAYLIIAFLFILGGSVIAFSLL